MCKEKKEKGTIKELVFKARKRMSKLGTKKVHKKILPWLKEQDIRCSRDRLFDVLRDLNMLVIKKKRYTITTNSYHRFRKYPNLIQGLKIERSEQVWVSDITYVKTKEKPMYLSLITAAHSQ
jgi:transposase InsO family protein